MTHSLTAPNTTRVRSGPSAVVLFAVLALGLLLQPAGAGAQTTLYGPFSDGCYYVWDSVQYIEGQCPQPDGSIDYYVPSANGWEYAMNVVTYTHGLTIITYADGTRLDFNSDGSLTLFATDGSYGIFASDGITLIEGGYVDSQGVMVQTTGTNRGGTLYPEVPGNLGATWPIFDHSVDLGIYASCLALAPSYDFNDDGYYQTSDAINHCS